MFHYRKRGKKGIYYVYWYEGGRKIGKPVSTDLGAVKEYIAQLADRIHRQRAGLPIRNMPFKEFADRYINNYSYANKSKSSICRDLLTIKIFKRLFPRVIYTDNYSAGVLEEYKARRRQEGVTDHSINRELGTLKSMLKYGVEKGFIDKNNFGKVSKCKTNMMARERVLTEKEIKLLLSSVLPVYKTAFMLGVYAGLRSGEACWLQWHDIDFKNRILRIRAKMGWKPKNQPSIRDVPIHKDLARHLQNMKATAQSEWVVAHDNGQRLDEKVLTAMVRKFRLKLNIQGLCFHILRHTFVSKMAEAGADLYAISRIIGHSNTHITESVYTHLKDKYYYDNIKKLSFAL